MLLSQAVKLEDNNELVCNCFKSLIFHTLRSLVCTVSIIALLTIIEAGISRAAIESIYVYHVCVQVKNAYINFLNHCYIDTEVEMKEIYTSNHMWTLFENFLVDMAMVHNTTG